MIQRKTQTAEYWGPGFAFTEDDVSHLYEVLVDRGSPCGIDELTLALIDYRCRLEETRIRDELAKGAVYQPKDDYEIGQRLVFPSYDFAAATVIDKRSGTNPEHGEFSVIKVQFEGKRKAREFAARLATPHRLNTDDGVKGLLQQDGLLSPAELKDSLARGLEGRLAEFLAGRAESGFIQSNAQWLLREMLTEVSVGQLNIAEALIEVAAQPLTLERLMVELDLPGEVPSEVRAFSLNHALNADERFDNIGQSGAYLWYLRRLEPEAALATPPLLQYDPQRYDRSLISSELLQLEWELGDEWSDDLSEAPAASPRVTLLLTYPHRRSGTLPLSSRTRAMFPAGESGRSMVRLVDGRWGQRFTGWAVYGGRYVVGLEPWYEEHKVPVGAYITLEQGPEPGEVVVDIRPRRMRREWVRQADVVDGRLEFEMRKMPISCDYDELMVVDALDPDAVLALAQATQQPRLPLQTWVQSLFLELLKLSPEGKVHAKTLYSALNLVRRLPPGPIFALLSSSESYRLVGGGYWSLA